ILLMGMVSSNAYAHYLWVNVDNYNPEASEEITISLGWGHLFPVDSQIAADKIERVYLISPEGKEIPLELKAGKEKGLVLPVKIKLEKTGTYLVVVEKKSGFVTKTTEGYKYQSKKGLKGVIKSASSWSEGSAKAIINVEGTAGGSFQKAINQRYQIIPLDDPGKLKEGDYLRVKVILDGKPYSTLVYATYAGFAAEKDTFAYTTRTDKEGIAKIKILKPGIWLIKASDKIPYPDTGEADNYSFTSSLTFGIK
ncbi:MAG: DUF4198 domain-containing protein, partial [bacterium]|nr:DUF4198 domain-containing protein [bacterium]